jgi:DNA topoisomerase-1
MTTKTLPIESLAYEDLARLAHLRYVLDEPGYTRKCNGKGFCYVNGSGSLRDPAQIKRINSLAIPPAWKEVWICKFPDGHLQATGRDDRGRKQYIYHEQWREISNLAKFFRLKPVPKFLPELRLQVARDLQGRKLNRRRVLAGMIAVLDLTSIRIGNEEYVRENGSYGLTTLRNRHVHFEGNRAILRFRAKAGLKRESVIDDRLVVKLLKQLKPLPGAHIFQYLDEAGAIHTADATTVNEYLRELTGHHFTAKDFRTWKASALAAGILYAKRDVEKFSQRKRVVKSAICAVSTALGNTPTVCRTYYVHPVLVNSYLEGQFLQIFQRFRPSPKKALTNDEQLLSRFLHRWSGGASMT